MRSSIFDILLEVDCEANARAALQTARAMERIVFDMLEREQLSPTKLRLLFAISAADVPLTMTQASSQLDRSIPVLVEAARMLLARSLIERSKSSSGLRSRRYVLTAEGLAVVDRCRHWQRYLL